MGILAELRRRTDGELESLRVELARTAQDDPSRAALEEHEVELELLADDIAHRVASPAVLQATAHLGANAGGARGRAKPRIALQPG
jgi:hypothetical protein